MVRDGCEIQKLGNFFRAGCACVFAGGGGGAGRRGLSEAVRRMPRFGGRADSFARGAEAVAGFADFADFGFRRDDQRSLRDDAGGTRGGGELSGGKPAGCAPASGSLLQRPSGEDRRGGKGELERLGTERIEHALYGGGRNRVESGEQAEAQMGVWV